MAWVHKEESDILATATAGYVAEQSPNEKYQLKRIGYTTMTSGLVKLLVAALLVTGAAVGIGSYIYLGSQGTPASDHEQKSESTEEIQIGADKYASDPEEIVIEREVKNPQLIISCVMPPDTPKGKSEIVNAVNPVFLITEVPNGRVTMQLRVRSAKYRGMPDRNNERHVVENVIHFGVIVHNEMRDYEIREIRFDIVDNWPNSVAYNVDTIPPGENAVLAMNGGEVEVLREKKSAYASLRKIVLVPVKN